MLTNNLPQNYITVSKKRQKHNSVFECVKKPKLCEDSCTGCFYGINQIVRFKSASSSEEEKVNYKRAKPTMCDSSSPKWGSSFINTVSSRKPSLIEAVSQYSDEEDEDNESCTARFRDTDTFNSQSFSINHSRNNSNVNGHVLSSSSSRRKRLSIISHEDIEARTRCFDYLVTAIDEAWAQYCGCYSYPDETDYITSSQFPTSPTSIVESGDESDHDQEQKSKELAANRRSPRKSISEEPTTVLLQQLKDRLLKAKYYLQDYVEGNGVNDSELFWKRWDLIKYSSVELVEDDDDYEAVEAIIDELEEGRYYSAGF